MKSYAFYFLLAVSLLFSSSQALAKGPVKTGKRYFLVSTKKLNLLPQNVRPMTLAKKNQFHLIQMNLEEALNFSEVIHKDHICGGFVDVHDEIVNSKQGLTSSFESVAQEAPVNNLDIPESLSNSSQVYRVSQNLSEKSYETFLKRLVAFSSRYARSDKGVEASNWLADQFKSIAAKNNRKVIVGSVATGGWINQNSVVVTVPGKDMSLPGIVIGAHMDSINRRNNNDAPGADDDGSGTTAVIEIFRAIMESGTQFKRNLYFSLYAGEELGLHGSVKVVSHFQTKNIPVRAVMQLDMIGYKSSRDSDQMYFVMDNINTGLTDFTKKLAVKYVGIPASDIGETKCGYACSDHASWHRKGFAATFPFEASFSNYNRDIHTSDDGVNNLDMNHAMKYVKLGTAFMVELGEPVK